MRLTYLKWHCPPSYPRKLNKKQFLVTSIHPYLRNAMCIRCQWLKSNLQWLRCRQHHRTRNSSLTSSIRLFNRYRKLFMHYTVPERVHTTDFPIQGIGSYAHDEAERVLRDTKSRSIIWQTLRRRPCAAIFAGSRQGKVCFLCVFDLPCTRKWTKKQKTFMGNLLTHGRYSCLRLRNG